MPTVSIFHANPPDWRNSNPPGTKYAHVADVTTDDLEVAYELTNSINKNWWLNEGVTPTFPGPGCRSTSVGDIAVSGGKSYRCGVVGWEEINSTVPEESA